MENLFAEHAVDDPEDDRESEILSILQDLYARLRQNNRNLKYIDLIHYLNVKNIKNFIFNNRRAIELGIALRNNTVVETIVINVKNMTLRGTGELVNYIVTSPSLKEFQIISRGQIQNRNEERQILAVVDRFLSAIAYKGNLKSLHVPHLFGSIPLATALRANCNSIEKLALYFQDTTTNLPVSRALMEETEMVASVVGALHMLKEINIVCCADGCFTASIIHILMNHPVLQKLVLLLDDMSIINVPNYAYNLQDLFRSTTPLEDVELKNYTFEFTEALPIILSGFYGHKTIRNLQLDICTFNDENAIAVCDLLRNNQSIKDLDVRVDSLRGFALIVDGLENNETLSHVIVMITKASMENPANLEACKQLEKSLASLKHLKHLEFYVERHPDNITFPPEIMRGLESNDCLYDIDFEWGRQMIYNEWTLANYYGRRNEWLPKLLDAATADEILNLFDEISQVEKDDHYLTIVYETLRRRDIFW